MRWRSPEGAVVAAMLGTLTALRAPRSTLRAGSLARKLTREDTAASGAAFDSQLELFLPFASPAARRVLAELLATEERPSLDALEAGAAARRDEDSTAFLLEWRAFRAVALAGAKSSERSQRLMTTTTMIMTMLSTMMMTRENESRGTEMTSCLLLRRLRGASVGAARRFRVVGRSARCRRSVEMCVLRVTLTARLS